VQLGVKKLANSIKKFSIIPQTYIASAHICAITHLYAVPHVCAITHLYEIRSPETSQTLYPNNHVKMIKPTKVTHQETLPLNQPIY
jgi:hypothetical protein